MPPRTHVGAEAAVEAALGPPEETRRESAALDDAEMFPAGLCARLDAVGLPAFYVPAEWGGRLDDHEVLLRLLRSVARRDVSAAVAHGKTYLGTACVWIAGSPEQAASTAAAVLDGGPVAWALSEPEHGADLLAGELTAVSGSGGYRLDGVKWPVNNATRAGLLTVLARTGQAGNPRGHSLFLVDKAALAPGTVSHLPKVRTHGIRGIDISGVRFDGAWVPAATMLGAEGTGIATVLHALQLTRTMCAALSLGAGEHALRLTARFAAARVLGGRPPAGRARPASILARCAALLAASEAVALAGSRSIHSLTAEMAVTSAVVKSVTPTLVDAALGDLAELLDARSFLTGGYEHGAFEKLWRDHRIVAIFDGSTPVNRAALIQQFPRLARAFAAGTVNSAGLADTVAAGSGQRPLDRTALTLTSRHGSSLVQSLPSLARSLAERPVHPGLAWHAEALSATAEELHTAMGAVALARRPAMAAYELAAAYELCYAGAACLWLWQTGAARHTGQPLWADGLWARSALRELRTRAAGLLRTPEPAAAPGDDDIDEALAGVVVEAATGGAGITPFGLPLPVLGSDCGS
ncbi:acyl-CoA dehydrogenase family protein [Streptomyces sp. NPDC088350]|uniref:acyl-CoA dehydrogenase family protein n=1 Tax=Streptomyces sp. NPDC088350 TaxID=3365854 RepID=UPI00381B7CD8